MKKLLLIKILTLFVLLLLTLITSCKKVETDPEVNFDRSKMLQNYADNIIIPSVSDLQSETQVLLSTVNNFATNPNDSSLIVAQQQFKKAFLSYQHCNAFTYGPGEQISTGLFTDVIGLFPTNPSLIESNISSFDTTTSSSNRNIRGFGSLDYLLFEGGDNAALLQKYTSNNRVRYLQVVARHLNRICTNLNAGWASYRSIFVGNTDTYTGSSSSLFFNGFVKSYEELKNFKVSLPIGKRINVPFSNATIVEGYYSNYSKELMIENFNSIEDLWYGRTKSKVDGFGLEDYILASNNGQQLVDNTKNQLAIIRSKINALPNKSINNMITQNDTSDINQLSKELTKTTRYFKSDITSALGLIVSFSSNDGD